MRTLLGFLVGLVVGAVGMVWFYTNGGKIMIAGRELGPPIAYVSGGEAAKAPVKQAQPQGSQLVVRDITDEPAAPARSEPRPQGGGDPAAAKGADGAGAFVTIVWPKW